MPPRHQSAAPPPAPPKSPSAAPNAPSSSASIRRAPFQFGVRSLFILVTVVAIVSALMPAYGAMLLFLAAIIFDLAILPVWLGAAALYSRGTRQTFFLGALAALLMSYVFIGTGFRETVASMLGIAIVQLATCALCGYVAVAARRFVERRGWHLPDDADRR